MCDKNKIDAYLRKLQKRWKGPFLVEFVSTVGIADREMHVDAKHL